MSKANFFIKNAYVAFSGMFGLYGASRQWRAEIDTNKMVSNTVITKPERFVFSVTNGFLYATPGLNIYYMYTLYDRMFSNNLSSKQNGRIYNDSYKELFGQCKEAF